MSPGGSDGKESACNVGDRDLIPESGRSLEKGMATQYSCLENPHGERSLASYNPWGCRVRHEWVTNTLSLTLPFTALFFWLVSRSVVPNSLQPHGPQPTRLLCPWDFPGKDTGVGCHFLLQGTFLTQGSNPGLLHYRQILYQQSYISTYSLDSDFVLHHSKCILSDWLLGLEIHINL